MDQAAVARHRLEAMEARTGSLCRAATPRRRPGLGGTNCRQPAWPRQVTVIVAMGGEPAALAARWQPRPIVFAGGTDPVRSGIVTSLHRPGGNITRASAGKTIRGAPKMPTELRYCIEVRLLRRRRQIADRHVLDHAAAKRADLSHRKTSCLKGGAAKNPRSS